MLNFILFTRFPIFAEELSLIMAEKGKMLKIRLGPLLCVDSEKFLYSKTVVLIE